MKNRNATVTCCVAAVALFALAAGPAFAGSVACPQPKLDGGGTISGFSNAPYEADVGAGADACNIIITFNANGSISTNLGALDPYDGEEDQLIGVVNNSSATIMAITLSNPGNDIFGFDGDGVCVYQPFLAAAPTGFACNGGSNSPANPDDYLGDATSFTGISAGLDAGTINWNQGIASGSSGYFSLEGPASLTLQVNPTTPEPATMSLIGLGLCGLYLARRRAGKR